MGESGGRRKGLGSRCNAMERTSLIWKRTKWPPRSAETQRWVACHTIRDRCMRISEQQSALDRRLTCSTAALCAPSASQKVEEKSLRAPLLRKTFGPRPTQEKYIWRALHGERFSTVHHVKSDSNYGIKMFRKVGSQLRGRRVTEIRLILMIW